VTANGNPITLLRVVVTPSEIRATVRISATHGLPAADWNPVMRVAVGSWNSTQPSRGGEGGVAASDGTYRYRFPTAPPQSTGGWTLSIDAINGYDPQQGSPHMHLAGPWVFRVTLA